MKKLVLLSVFLITSSLAHTRTGAIQSPGTDVEIEAEALTISKESFEDPIRFTSEILTREQGTALLQVHHDEEGLIRVSLSLSIYGNNYTFTCQMAQSAADESKVTLSTYLCDDGRLAVIGGGPVFQIKLGGIFSLLGKTIE